MKSAWLLHIVSNKTSSAARDRCDQCLTSVGRLDVHESVRVHTTGSLRVKLTPTWFPTNSLYTPLDNTPMHDSRFGESLLKRQAHKCLPCPRCLLFKDVFLPLFRSPWWSRKLKIWSTPLSSPTQPTFLLRRCVRRCRRFAVKTGNVQSANS